MLNFLTQAVSVTTLPFPVVRTLNHYRTHTRPFNGPFSRTTWVSRYQKGNTNLNFTDSEWQWHQLGHMQVCTSLQTDNHASTPPLSFLQAGCSSCCPTNSIKALKALNHYRNTVLLHWLHLLSTKCKASVWCLSVLLSAASYVHTESPGGSAALTWPV